MTSDLARAKILFIKFHCSFRDVMGTRVRVLNIVTCSTMDVTGLPSLIVQLIPFYVC